MRHWTLGVEESFHVFAVVGTTDLDPSAMGLEEGWICTHCSCCLAGMEEGQARVHLVDMERRRSVGMADELLSVQDRIGSEEGMDSMEEHEQEASLI